MAPRTATDRPETGSPFPKWTWIVFGALYAFIIPWWLPQGEPVLWLGAPRWVVTALVGGLAVAVTVNVLLRRYWHD